VGRVAGLRVGLKVLRAAVVGDLLPFVRTGCGARYLLKVCRTVCSGWPLGLRLKAGSLKAIRERWRLVGLLDGLLAWGAIRHPGFVVALREAL
jgi:hypothetical protein